MLAKNNAGKSTLLQSVLCLQSTSQQSFFQPKEAMRVGASEFTVRIRLQDIEAAYFNTHGIEEGDHGDVTLSFTPESLPRAFTFISRGTDSAEIPGVKLITHQEPHNFILPYTMKRFAQSFNTLSGNNAPQPKWCLNRLISWRTKFNPIRRLRILITNGLINYVRILSAPLWVSLKVAVDTCPASIQATMEAFPFPKWEMECLTLWD